ncbi:McrC family protein [Flavobacterium sp. LS1R10]|uniref:McrC family protein n=1 Tax=Flavobacterium sp. LS1R10 TaxID=2497482 RepID=UPI000F821D3A|nr:McrC family protein [Flavobacterium sp. LS1R10]RTY76233.1 restriction endonuclease [Flavobacterium sp. LS1R10]
MKRQSYHICEYGVIRSLNDYGNESQSSLSELYLPEKQFDSFHNYISQNQDDSPDGEKPFSLFSKGKRKQIKVKNYVGVIETKDGLHLEILPKIHFNKTTDELGETKSVFLRMLKHLKNSPFVNISKAHIETKKDFPILEVFIKSYINEAERVFTRGVKSDYVLHEDNVPYLKGKLKINQNIKYNFANKAKFYCEFSEYSQNIPANRLVKSTLIKLLKITNSYNNSYSINKLLSHLEEVDVSSNIKADLTAINSSNRLLSKYKSLLLWSEIFLLNKSFTNFKGDNLNMAILFPMQKIFEDYIAFLFGKYSDGFKIRVQDKSYFLVEKHKGANKFRLKPDIVIDKEATRKKIVDTKWKLLDEFAERKNYNISQADMYQLYAYGRKYTNEKIDPCLVLIYPSNPNFSNKLDNFIYEGDLTLEVVPFDLSGDELHQQSQIERILKEL